MKTGNISEIMVPCLVVLGKVNLPVSRLAEIAEGTILELDSLAGEPVAKAEVVVIDENFGVRITGLIPAAPQG